MEINQITEKISGELLQKILLQNILQKILEIQFADVL